MSFSVPQTLFLFFYLARREASLFLQNSLHPVIVQGSLLVADATLPWLRGLRVLVILRALLVEFFSGGYNRARKVYGEKPD